MENNTKLFKTQAAAESVKQWNKEVNLWTSTRRVCKDTENEFDDRFYDMIDCICVAVDNVASRLYLDSQAVYYRKPMVECGTSTTQGSTQVHK